MRTLLLCAVLLWPVPLASDAPTLSELQKLQLQNAILTRDLAQARLDALVREWTVPGYELLGSGEYVKKPAP